MNLAKQEDRGANGHYNLDVTALLNLDVPPDCLAGIEANMELLRIHARKVEAFVSPEKTSGADES